MLADQSQKTKEICRKECLVLREKKRFNLINGAVSLKDLLEMLQNFTTEYMASTIWCQYQVLRQVMCFMFCHSNPYAKIMHEEAVFRQGISPDLTLSHFSLASKQAFTKWSFL